MFAGFLEQGRDGRRRRRVRRQVQRIVGIVRRPLDGSLEVRFELRSTLRAGGAHHTQQRLRAAHVHQRGEERRVAETAETEVREQGLLSLCSLAVTIGHALFGRGRWCVGGGAQGCHQTYKGCRRSRLERWEPRV